MISPEIIYVIIILFFSSLIRSTFGFGDALTAMPLLAMIIGIRAATPLVALVAIVIATFILIDSYKEIKIKNLLMLIISSIAGIPIGLYYLKGVDEAVIKIVLAVILISFSVYKLLRPNLLHIKNDRYAFIFGFLGGILGGAYNTNGPPIIIYGVMRKWHPERFRALLQGVFFPVNLAIAVSHGIGGLWTKQVWIYFLSAILPIGLAIFIGIKISKRISKEKFSKFIYILLILIGLLLGVKTII